MERISNERGKSLLLVTTCHDPLVHTESIHVLGLSKNILFTKVIL